MLHSISSIRILPPKYPKRSPLTITTCSNKNSTPLIPSQINPMQPSNSTGSNSNSTENPENLKSPKSPSTEFNVTATANSHNHVQKRSDNVDDEVVLDVTGKSLEFDLLEKSDDSVEGLYLYKNAFSLVPKSVGRLRKLKTVKFFGNEVNLFPAEFGNLVGLECLQVKVSSPGLNGLSFSKFKGLKELELSKVPPRPSVMTILSEISGIKCLTKLSVCHFSIRYLPPEIGCLSNLEYLDLSFNKIKILPKEITCLNALISLTVSNNKLVKVPSSLLSLQRLESLDLSSNRLTSLGSLELTSMHSLQYLNLQNNRLLSCCQIPSWICCKLEGNGRDLSNDDFISSSVEMDVNEASFQGDGNNFSCNGSNHAASSLVTGPSSNNRCFATRRSCKRWKRIHYLQQKARQERLNNSRKWKAEGHAEALAPKESESFKLNNLDVSTSEICEEGISDITGLDDDVGSEKVELSGEAEVKNLLISVEADKNSSKKGVESCSCNLGSIDKSEEELCCVEDESLGPLHGEADSQDENALSEKSKITYKSKRRYDRDLDNPKPCKCQRPTEDSSSLSCKYSNLSFCSIEDRLPDGFYDAGRNRPFMPLMNFEQILSLDSREVILLDREKDEQLDAITLSAKSLVYSLKRLNGSAKERNKVAVDNLQIASLLALFVSDHFGGSDRSGAVERTRKAVSGSNYRKPFVCTCSTGNNENISSAGKQTLETADDIFFSDLCERSLRSIKARQGSIVIPLGSLQFGVCRHRALLMKYLCDRMDPPVPCELVRGYLDFTPHAWNVILSRRGDSVVRMVVDACRPHDIREETDLEYFSRYVPLSRTKVPLSTKNIPTPGCSFPSLSTSDEIGKVGSSTLIRCKFESVEAAAKVRTLEVCEASADEIRNFEYSCLGEVRVLGALQHSCVVEMYGHQLSSRWIPSEGNPERRIIQSVILMEYVNGGSLKDYLEEVSKTGEKHVPAEMALCIARDVACALAEIHSKDIIHRDIKSENILIDLDKKRADGMPLVKLCDFDRAVPLRSFLHTCCIAHRGVAPPDVCVGTPRWMAPEVLRAMDKRNTYGLEVDIWSYGCLLLELLTLQVPYTDLPDLRIHELLQSGKRPPLTDELEALGSIDEHLVTQSGSDLEGLEVESETLRFLVDLFCQCTKENPADRPKASDIYKLLLARTSV